MGLTTFSSEDMLEKYLISQSKLSTMVHKPKIKTPDTKKDFKINMESKEPIEKSKESGSEYFPSTDSGKQKLGYSTMYKNSCTVYCIIFYCF